MIRRMSGGIAYIGIYLVFSLSFPSSSAAAIRGGGGTVRQRGTVGEIEVRLG